MPTHAQTANHADISSLEKRERLSAYLNEIAAALANSRDTPTALELIAGFIVPAFTNWFTLDILRDDTLVLAVLKHQDPEKIDWAYQYRKNYPPDINGNSGQAVVLKSGKAAMVSVVTRQMIDAIIADPVQRAEVEKIGLHSVIMTPVICRGKTTGLLNFISSDPGRYFDDNDLHFAENFAGLIGLALENTRLNEEAEKELALRKQGEEQVRFLIDSIPHKVWTSGPDGRATYYNSQWYNYIGVFGFEKLREAIWDCIYPEDREVAEVEWPRAILEGNDTELEHRIKRHDGEYRWHLSRFTAHKNENGEVIQWVGTSTDIHDQKVYELELFSANEGLFTANEELEAANEEQTATNEELLEAKGTLEKTVTDLAASDSRFRFLLNAIPQQVWTATTDGALNYVNEVVCRDFGFSGPDIVGHGWQAFIHPDDIEVCLKTWTNSLATGKEYMVEFRLLFYDGKYRWHLARALPFIEDGVTKLWIGTNTNIDLQKSNEQRKDEFISIASHELKTPLTNIKAFNQLLQKIKDPERLEPFAKKSSDQILKLERLINDLLDVTKINAGRMTYTNEVFDFAKLLEDAVESARFIEHRHQIVLDNNANVQYTGDPYRLEQVINNLISNAAKYSGPGTEVIVRSMVEPDGIVVSVQDFGIGIAPQHKEHLFDRYFRVDNTAMRFEGLGLGLFISSEILKRHQASLWIESELGKGSTFFFRLPLNQN